MKMKFEDLLGGKAIHELSDEEINEIIKQLDVGETTRFVKEARKATKTKRPSKKAQENSDLFDKAILGGGKNE